MFIAHKDAGKLLGKLLDKAAGKVINKAALV
jgi:hypothetical protein